MYFTVGFRGFFERPGYAGVKSVSSPVDNAPDELEFLVDQSGNTLMSKNGDLLITSNGLYKLKDQSSNVLIDNSGNELVAYIKNKNFVAP